MKAIVLARHGRPDVLQVKSVADPHPLQGEVGVKIHAIGLNYAEILSRKGVYSWAPQMPYVPGMEAFGEIDELGEGVRNRSLGEKVVIGTQHGTYAERIVVKEEKALPAIESFSSEENAAFPVNYMTAWISLFEMARIRPTDSVLVQAAAGGVGTAAVQLAKHYGCRVIGTASSDRKLELLTRLNADGAIDYCRTDFQEELNHLTGNEGVDVILETVGGEVFRKSLKVVRPLGRIVVAGFSSLDLKKWSPASWIRAWYNMPRSSVPNMAQNAYGVMAFHLGYLLAEPARLRRIWGQLVAFTVENNIRPVVGHTFEFDQMSEAHRLMESRESMGKIIARVVDYPADR